MSSSRSVLDAALDGTIQVRHPPIVRHVRAKDGDDVILLHLVNTNWPYRMSVEHAEALLKELTVAVRRART